MKIEDGKAQCRALVDAGKDRGIAPLERIVWIPAFLPIGSFVLIGDDEFEITRWCWDTNKTELTVEFVDWNDAWDSEEGSRAHLLVNGWSE